MKIATLDLQRIDVKIGNEDIAHLIRLWSISRVCAAWRTMSEFVSSSGRMSELGIAIGKSCKISGQVLQLSGDQMNNLAFSLDFPLDRHHGRPKHDATSFFKKTWPDDDIGNAGLIFDRDEHDAFCASRLLANKHQTGGTNPAPVTCIHCVDACDYPS